jgi:alpha-beta hydrolase superfamily lysophospholipase
MSAPTRVGPAEQASSSSELDVSTPGNRPVQRMYEPTETERRVVPLVNLPKTTNVFRTSRGVNLHFRYHLPVSSKKIESIVFLIHGYGGHSNSQRTLKIAENFSSFGRALFLLDLVGHGYSEGERALFTRHQDLVEDIYEFISVVSGLTSTSQQKTGFECGFACIFPGFITSSEPTITWDIGSAKHDAIKRAPFYIMGNSLGGALGVFLAPRLFGNVKFRGLILLAPSLEFKMPSAAITGLLEVTFATFSPNEVMPDWIMGPREPQPITWKEELLKEQVEQGKLWYII